jgi:hypothetical protein
VDYEQWIERERRIRVKILISSISGDPDNMIHVCGDCEEICLCHEEICPNCNSDNMAKRRISLLSDLESRIRCRHRFINLSK